MSNFIPEAGKKHHEEGWGTELYRCLRDLNDQCMKKHQETIDLLRSKESGTKEEFQLLQSAVKRHSRIISAVLNVMNFFKGEAPKHFPRQAHEAMEVNKLMNQVFQSIKEEREIRRLQSVKDLQDSLQKVS